MLQSAAKSPTDIINPLKTEIEQLLRQALATLHEQKILSEPADDPVVTHTKDPRHGDFASNIAMISAKKAGINPRQLAAKLICALPASAHIEKTEIAGPGFINFFLAQHASHSVITQILQQGNQFGCSDAGQNRKVLLEFVSANPTGPLHVGHGRQAALGDALARLLDSQGYRVDREFYYNDAGVQIHNLALSVQARAKGLQPGDAGWPEQAYNGEYIDDIAKDFLANKTTKADDGQAITASGDIDNLEDIRQFAVAYLRHEQDLDLASFDVKFDRYYLESSLYSDGKVEETVAALQASGKTYASDGALWLRSTEYGDDKDRVMRKSDGNYTYFVPDVAYHVNKWQRGYHKAVNIQGTDHFGTVARVRAGLQALNIGIGEDYPAYVLHNMVKVVRGGEEVKISKRAGSYVTLRDLTSWVGRDAVRFFLVSRRADAQFVFDIDLALKENDENPVYYVQYAHARINSVFRQLQEKQMQYSQDDGLKQLEQLCEPHETALIKTLNRYPEMLAKATQDEEPHQITYYLRELANEFHSYYNAHQFLIDNDSLRHARLALISACGQVFRNALAIIGVSAPEHM